MLLGDQPTYMVLKKPLYTYVAVPWTFPTILQYIREKTVSMKFSRQQPRVTISRELISKDIRESYISFSHTNKSKMTCSLNAIHNKIHVQNDLSS